MKFFNRHKEALPATVEDTSRMEAYSDAVIAIIVTLLILDLHVPELSDASLNGVLHALSENIPGFVAFAFSFLTLSVFWVNHHHFYRELSRTDAGLLWHNNFLLFCLALIPFTTSFISRYPMVPAVLIVYCFVLFMGALSFMLMVRHALYSGCFLHAEVSDTEKNQSYRRTYVGVVIYGLGTVLALFVPWASALAMIVVPVYYIAPRMLHDHDEH